MGNDVKQGGKLSPLLFNVYMDHLSDQQHKRPTDCSLDTTVVNHLVYADDLLLFAPIAKGLQTLLDICYTYGWEHDVQYNAGKSLVIYFDCRNTNLASEITLGGKKLNFTTSCKYLGHVIFNNISDEADIQANVRLLYAKSNMLHQKFNFCSTAIKNKLVVAYFSNIYMCALWVNCRKANFQQFDVAYNNSYRILNRLPMRYSASHMFTTANVNLCKCVTRKAIFSLMTSTDKSLNPITQNITISDMYCTSKLQHSWILALYNF